MLRMVHGKIVFFISVMILIILPGCFARRGPVDVDFVTEHLIGKELLKNAGLETIWEYILPMNAGDTVSQLYVRDDLIYILSKENFIFCLDRNNSKRMFESSFGPPGFGILGFDLYDDEVISIVGNRLVQVDSISGIEKTAKNIEFGITCPAARNRDNFYIAGSDNRIRILRARDKVQLFQVAAENDSAITSLVAADDMMIFATQQGNVIATLPNKNVKLWQFDASEAIADPIVREGNALYVSSKDTYIYKLDVRNPHSPLWKYQTAAMLEHGPVLTKNVLYQNVRNKGLIAIDTQTGKFIWLVRDGLGILAQDEHISYVIKPAGEIVKMDNKLKKQLNSVTFPNVTSFAVNTIDSKIYLAGKAGRIVCLKPAQ
ncbi:MAG: outer membrane protein assembly factor BamB family protein [Planctomycetota bacterium]|jgi:outer membrane protein assembly factor BamB